MNPKFNWFLSQEFSKLRDGFKPTNYKDDLDSKRKSSSTKKNDDSHDSAVTKISPVLPQDDECSTSLDTSLPTIKEEEMDPTTNPDPITNNNEDSHKGENCHSKNTTSITLQQTSPSEQKNNCSSIATGVNTLLFLNDSTSLVKPSLLLSPKSTRSKIEAGLFTNPLISESDY